MRRVGRHELIFGTLLAAIVIAFFVAPDPPSSGVPMSAQDSN